MKTKILIAFFVLFLAVIFVGGIFSVSQIKNKTKIVACTAEAKLCPDGSAVGRSGPNCEFAECPGANTSATTTPIYLPQLQNTGKIGNKILIQGISITPLELRQDSRCPEGVYCIWAGTVEIRVRLEKGTNTTDVFIKLGEIVSFDGKGVLFKSVLPNSKGGASINPSDYFFEFSIVPLGDIKPGNTENGQIF